MRHICYILCLCALGCQSAALTSAKMYLQQGETENARKQLEAALETEPQNAEIHYLLGKIAADEGRYQDMAGAFDKSAALSPRFHQEISQVRQHYWAREYNTGVGLAGGDEPDFEAAGRSFSSAITINPERLEAWRNMAYVYYQMERYDTAIQTYEHITAKAPSDTASLFSLAILQINDKNYERALDTLTRLRELTPDDRKVYLNLALCYETLERPEEAEAAYKEAVRVDPTYAPAHYNMGNFYWHRDDYGAASQAYEKALELEADDDTRYNLALTYLELEELDRAIALLEDLSTRLDDNASVWMALSKAYAKKDMARKSQEAYDRAQSLGE